MMWNDRRMTVRGKVCRIDRATPAAVVRGTDKKLKRFVSGFRRYSSTSSLSPGREGRRGASVRVCVIFYFIIILFIWLFFFLCLPPIRDDGIRDDDDDDDVFEAKSDVMNDWTSSTR